MTEKDVVIVFTTEPKEEQKQLAEEFKANMENLGFVVTIGAPPKRPTR